MTRRRIVATLGLVGLLLLFVVVGLLASVGLWLRFGPDALPEALAALQTDARVRVDDTASAITFMPQSAPPGGPTVGFLFWQGGRVDARAYAPLLRPLAEDGVLVVVPKAFVRAAIFNAPRDLAAARAAHPSVTTWVLGGHSLGGASAGLVAASDPAAIAGLVQWAAYPPADLSASRLPVLVVYGTADGLALVDDVLAARPNFSQATQLVPIEGGNHAQFGVYGPQDGDNPAAISAEAQRDQVVAATRAFLAQVAASAPAN